MSALCAALVTAAMAMGGCSELAQPNETTPSGLEPPYVALAAKYLQAQFKDRAAYDGFEISNLRWVNSLRGWDWTTCVHYRDHGRLRTYVLFMDGNTVVDGRYSVETDSCESQTYSPFDVVSGTLGRPTAPVQPALY